jgi:hypothetical protein
MTQRSTQIEPLLGVHEVAVIFNTTAAAVRESRRRGTIPGSLAFQVGRILKWDPDEVRAAIADAKAERGDAA